MKKPGSAAGRVLKKGDKLSVPKVLETVGVGGEVFYQGRIPYGKLASVGDYAGLAGDFSEKGRAEKAYVVYAKGTGQRTKRFLWVMNYPETEPGAEIVVPQKPDQNKLGPQELQVVTTEILSMIDQLYN